MTLSLRSRLLAAVLVSTSGLLALFGVGLYAMTRRTVLRDFDGQLWTTARMLAAVIEEEHPEESDGPDEPSHQPGHQDEAKIPVGPGGGSLEFNLDVGMIPEFNRISGGAYYELRTMDGRVVLRSPSLGNSELPFVGFHRPGMVMAPMPCSLPGGRPGRMVTYGFRPRQEDAEGTSGSWLILNVARDAGEMMGFLRTLRGVLWVGSAGIVVLAIVVAGLVVRSGLAPVRRLAEEIATIDAETVERRVSADRCPAELREIAECVNALLDRIARSFERERRFTADVAHELRTPLAGLRSALEVCLRQPREEAEYRRVAAESLQIVCSLGRLVETLLSLGRLENRHVPLDQQPLELRGLVDEVWQTFESRAQERGLWFENRVDADAVWTSDRDHLGMVVSNLLDNAVEYCDEGGRIWVETTGEDGTWLIVCNTGCRLSPEEAANVFESFWRAEASRTDTGRHCGVGLAVVRRVCRLLGLHIEADVHDGVFTVRLTPRVD